MQGKLTPITVVFVIVCCGVNEQKQIDRPGFELKKLAFALSKIYHRANRRIVSADKTCAGFQC